MFENSIQRNFKIAMKNWYGDPICLILTLINYSCFYIASALYWAQLWVLTLVCSPIIVLDFLLICFGAWKGYTALVVEVIKPFLKFFNYGIISIPTILLFGLIHDLCTDYKDISFTFLTALLTYFQTPRIFFKIYIIMLSALILRHFYLDRRNTIKLNMAFLATCFIYADGDQVSNYKIMSKIMNLMNIECCLPFSRVPLMGSEIMSLTPIGGLHLKNTFRIFKNRLTPDCGDCAVTICRGEEVTFNYLNESSYAIKSASCNICVAGSSLSILFNGYWVKTMKPRGFYISNAYSLCEILIMMNKFGYIIKGDIMVDPLLYRCHSIGVNDMISISMQNNIILYHYSSHYGKMFYINDYSVYNMKSSFQEVYNRLSNFFGEKLFNECLSHNKNFFSTERIDLLIFELEYNSYMRRPEGVTSAKWDCYRLQLGLLLKEKRIPRGVRNIPIFKKYFCEGYYPHVEVVFKDSVDNSLIVDNLMLDCMSNIDHYTSKEIEKMNLLESNIEPPNEIKEIYHSIEKDIVPIDTGFKSPILNRELSEIESAINEIKDAYKGNWANVAKIKGAQLCKISRKSSMVLNDLISFKRENDNKIIDPKIILEEQLNKKISNYKDESERNLAKAETSYKKLISEFSNVKENCSRKFKNNVDLGKIDPDIATNNRFQILAELERAVDKFKLMENKNKSLIETSEILENGKKIKGVINDGAVNNSRKSSKNRGNMKNSKRKVIKMKIITTITAKEKMNLMLDQSLKAGNIKEYITIRKNLPTTDAGFLSLKNLRMKRMHKGYKNDMLKQIVQRRLNKVKEITRINEVYLMNHYSNMLSNCKKSINNLRDVLAERGKDKIQNENLLKDLIHFIKIC